MRIVKHEKPKLKLPKFKVDGILAEHLNKNALLALMNRHFTCGVLGRAGSGKTSLVTGLLGTRGYFKRVFDTILVFIPPNSRQSMKDSIFNSLPDNQIYDSLTREHLESAYERAEKNARDEKVTLIVFDDVQQYFKNREIESFLLHMINNRRHARLSFFVIAQSYQKIPRQVRLALTDVFCFRLSKSNMDDIFNELVEFNETDWRQCLSFYKHRAKDPAKHSYLYLNVGSQRVFCDWDELLISDEWSDDEPDGDGDKEVEGETREAKRQKTSE